MRVDIKHLVAKGPSRKLVDQVMQYAQLMKQQGKTLERIIVTHAQHLALLKLVSNRGRVVLCCGDVIVHHNHEPIDERAPEPVARYVAALPPVSANPFGVAAVKEPAVDWRDIDDDDVPF